MNLNLDALQNHLCNLQVHEVLVLNLKQEKIDPEKDTPENFLVNLQRKPNRACSISNLSAVAPLDTGKPDAAIEGARFTRETAHRPEKIDAVAHIRKIEKFFYKSNAR